MQNPLNIMQVLEPCPLEDLETCRRSGGQCAMVCSQGAEEPELDYFSKTNPDCGSAMKCSEHLGD